MPGTIAFPMRTLAISTTDNTRQPRGAALLILLIGAAVVAAAEVHAGGLKGLFSFFTCLTLLPLALLYPAIRFMTREDGVLILLAIIVIVGVGSCMYVEAIFVHVDPQSGLIFLSVPSCQLVAVLVLYLIVYISRSIRRRHSKPEAVAATAGSRTNGE